MDLSQPFAAVAPTLDGPVLSVFVRVDGALSAGQVIDLCSEGSPAGIRKVLNRLVDQGVIVEERIGRSYAYRANREHVVWEAIELIAASAKRLEQRIIDEVATWDVEPLSVEMFGSVASGRADAESDVDIMVVAPQFDSSEAERKFEAQLDRLSESVQRWSGNDCNIITIEPEELVGMRESGERLLEGERRPVGGFSLDDLVPNATVAQGLRETLEQLSRATSSALSPQASAAMVESAKNLRSTMDAQFSSKIDLDALRLAMTKNLDERQIRRNWIDSPAARELMTNLTERAADRDEAAR